MHLPLAGDEVAVMQPQRLADRMPSPRRCEQAEERRVGGGPKHGDAACRPRRTEPSGPDIKTLLTLLVGLVISPPRLERQGAHDDKQQPRYADNFHAFTASEQGLLAEVSITLTPA